MFGVITKRMDILVLGDWTEKSIMTVRAVENTLGFCCGITSLSVFVLSWRKYVELCQITDSESEFG